MEGVERHKVRLCSYNPNWDKEYQETKKQIQRIWRSNLLDIQHVGSTAVPLIPAKPILDIAVRLQSIHNMDIENLKNKGYDYCGAREGRSSYHLFVLRGENEISLQHIHCYDSSDNEFFNLVKFRDYLNSHPDTAKEYAVLKEKLALEYPHDRISYTKGKENFIQTIYRLFY